MSDFEGVEILIPSLALDAPDLTPDKIKMALANHAQILRQVAEAVNEQALIITSLLYTVRSYMKEYPLKALDPNDVTPAAEPVLPGHSPGQYL